MEKEEIKMVAEDIETVMHAVETVFPRITLMMAARKDMKTIADHYSAMGPIDGFEYFDKDKKNRAELRRLDAIINLIVVSIETQDDLL